jgi:hypothetical protein
LKSGTLVPSPFQAIHYAKVCRSLMERRIEEQVVK